MDDRRKKGRQRAGAHAERYFNFLSYCIIIMLLFIRLLKLSLEQKCDVATRELDELRDELTKRGEEKEKVLDHHRVSY